jgi:hypothetical protein
LVWSRLVHSRFSLYFCDSQPSPNPTSPRPRVGLGSPTGDLCVCVCVCVRRNPSKKKSVLQTPSAFSPCSLFVTSDPLDVPGVSTLIHHLTLFATFQLWGGLFLRQRHGLGYGLTRSLLSIPSFFVVPFDTGTFPGCILGGAGKPAWETEYDQVKI